MRNSEHRAEAEKILDWLRREDGLNHIQRDPATYQVQATMALAHATLARTPEPPINQMEPKITWQGTAAAERVRLAQTEPNSTALYQPACGDAFTTTNRAELAEALADPDDDLDVLSQF